jgi:hypothetical protein
MHELPLDYEGLTDYLSDYCKRIQSLDRSIRFVGLADYAGSLLASFYRPGLVPLMDRKETSQYALQTVFRARTRGGFKPQLGEQVYAVAAYQNLIRATITLANPDAEHHNIYLLISLDIRSQYPAILEQVAGHVANNKNELFARTRILSNKYVD